MSPRVALVALLLAAPLAAAQDTPTPPTPPPSPPSGGTLPGGPPKTSPDRVPGTIQEVFPAPTEEDWKRPCLLTWQRTWEDALAVSKETRRAILVCVNMDGEPASEHYAGRRYRDPEVARLYEPYVCVIASVYRHTPVDADEEGARIPCPRFGGVTCGEHIAIEPVLYEKYFDGQRIAPRHICIETDGTETYDVFYANDVTSVMTTLKDQIAVRKDVPRTVVRGDRPVLERVASRAVEDRLAVEAAYRAGDAALRRSILEAAARNPDAAPLEVLRLALFGTDPEMARLARKALAATSTPEAVPLLSEALRSPMDAAEREALLAALGRLGASSPKARWITAAHRGIGAKSTAIDVKGWLTPGSEYPSPANVSEEGKAAIDLAERTLADAFEARSSEGGDSRSARMFSGLLFEDARRAAVRAGEIGAAGWRTRTVLALCAHYTGKVEESYALAEAAVKEVPPGDRSRNSMLVLTVFAEGRWKAIKAAVKAKREYPPSWLADLHSVYSVLLRHPFTTDVQIDWHCELLAWLGVQDRADQVLREGLVRFPESEPLHVRLRRRALEQKGPAGLEAAYAAMLKENGATPGLKTLAARASVEAAEQYRRVRKPDEAAAAYDRALSLLGDAPEADAAAALVHAGRARLALVGGDAGRALEEILASFRRRPEGAGDRDGLGFSPADTSRLILARLKEAKDAGGAARLEAALTTLDPELLRPDRP